MHTFYLKVTIDKSLNTPNYVWSNLLTFYYGCGTWSEIVEDATFVTAAIFNKTEESYYNITGLTIGKASSCQILALDISTKNTTFTAQTLLVKSLPKSDLIWQVDTA